MAQSHVYLFWLPYHPSIWLKVMYIFCYIIIHPNGLKLCIFLYIIHNTTPKKVIHLGHPNSYHLKVYVFG
jgi:hypothetical protein